MFFNGGCRRKETKPEKAGVQYKLLFKSYITLHLFIVYICAIFILYLTIPMVFTASYLLQHTIAALQRPTNILSISICQVMNDWTNLHEA